MSGAMAQQHAPTPSFAPESSAMAAEAKYEQVRQSLLQAGVTDKNVYMCVGRPYRLYTTCTDFLCYICLAFC